MPKNRQKTLSQRKLQATFWEQVNQGIQLQLYTLLQVYYRFTRGEAYHQRREDI